MAKKPEFRRVVKDGAPCYVKTLPNGSTVERHGRGFGSNFSACDYKGRYLGWTPTQEVAEFMAVHGRPNVLDDASDLNLWVAWNDARESGVIFYQAADGTQYLSLGYQTLMTARPDEHGWDVSLISRDLAWEQLQLRDQVWALTIANEPYRLE